MDKNCEACGSPPPAIASGPFAGSRSMHDYCVHCSKDLCDDCMRSKPCRETESERHLSQSAADEEDASGKERGDG